MRLKNKIALVTGASQGIGESIAKIFAAEGAFVIIADVKDSKGIKVANDIGQNARYAHLDVSDELKWKKIASEIKKEFGRLDVLVNNAGIIGLGEDWSPQNPEACSLDDWHRIHAVNLDGVFLGCKYAIPLMKDNGGSIINMSSRSGLVGVPNACGYASTKAAIKNHSKSVALYCCEKGYGIRCNCLCPAAIMTPIWDEMLGTDIGRAEAINAIESTIPMGKMGLPEDVAYAALYLASDESKYLTGSEIDIDGGVLAGTASSPKPKR